MAGEKIVLIVEDSPTVRFEVKIILDKAGITLIETSNEYGMLNVLEQFGDQIKLIIMDLTLKNENGFDIIKRLKEDTNSPYNDIPVLILTEHSTMEDVLKAKELGVEGYLKKPIQKDDMLNRIKKIF
ncbi:MAG: response regulator [Clostridia bacterium]|nr:response regulator [Clostridia bacterium]